MKACSGLIDDDDVFTRGRVVPAKVTAVSQTHAHGAEITRRDNIHQRSAELARAVHSSFRLEPPASIAVERKHVGDTGRFDTGDFAHAAQYFPQNGAAAL